MPSFVLMTYTAGIASVVVIFIVMYTELLFFFDDFTKK